jgi:hypothetical protein
MGALAAVREHADGDARADKRRDRRSGVGVGRQPLQLAVIALGSCPRAP